MSTAVDAFAGIQHGQPFIDLLGHGIHLQVGGSPCLRHGQSRLIHLGRRQFCALWRQMDWRPFQHLLGPILDLDCLDLYANWLRRANDDHPLSAH